MIKIIKKRPQVNFNDRVIGVKGDNETAYREFTIDRIHGEIDLANYVPIIEIKPVNKNEPAYYDVLAYEVQGGSIYMRWDIKSHNTKDDGNLEFQIYFGQTDDTSIKVFQTYTDYFAVAKGIEGKEIGESIPPDVFEAAVVKATEQANLSANSAKQAEEALSKVVNPSASVESVSSEDEASVTVEEVNGKAAFKFKIPRGKKGDTGDKGDKGDKGETGEDGYSPVISVTPITNGYRVTIKDVNGDKSFDVTDGADGNNGANGNDGYSPTINISDIDGGHEIRITDKNGEKEFVVMDGKDGVDGADGQDGKDGGQGDSAYQVAVDNGFKGSEQDWLDSLKGEQGEGAYPYEIKELQYDYDVYLDVNEVYRMTIDKDCNFILPAPKPGKIEQILIMADITTAGLSVTWGTEHFFDRCVPDLIVGECNIIFESNGTNWFAGIMLKGENDEQGGYNYIPKRGVDYWTEEDKAEMIGDVIAALPIAEGVEF